MEIQAKRETTKKATTEYKNISYDSHALKRRGRKYCIIPGIIARSSGFPIRRASETCAAFVIYGEGEHQ